MSSLCIVKTYFHSHSSSVHSLKPLLFSIGRLEMAPSFNTLSIMLSDLTHFLFDDCDPPPPGEHQYQGLHFSAVIRCALNWTYNSKLATFGNALSSLEDSSLSLEDLHVQEKVNMVLNMMIQTIKILGVHELHQYSLDITPKTVDTVASFIDFLVDALERLSTSSYSWIIIPSQTSILCKRLKFLNVFLSDTPFQFIEQEESKNILAEIQSVSNKAGNFFYSFFITTDHVTITAMELELLTVLSKLEVLEEKIKTHYATVIEQSKFTTPNFTSASIFIVDSLLADLNHLLDQKANLLVEVKDQITTFYEELYSCRWILRDTRLQQNKESIKYEIQLIDLAYQAEYIIGYFGVGEVPDWYLSLRLHSFIQKSNIIWASLAKFKPDSGLTDVRITQGSSEVFSSQVVAKSIPMSDEIIVGFKQTRRQIASDLIGGPKCLQIIAIIGMGGLGKTTIARKLYNDSNVLLHFDRRCWCVVSQTYQKTKLLTDILSSVSALKKDAISNMEDHQLADRVYKSLKGTRYLLVVDDIWEKEAWDDLKRYFPDDRNGSRILFTSRNKDVALQCSSEPIIHALPLLSANECWDLLQKTVFRDSFCPEELQDVGKEIARNCKGLPIVVVGIATVLANIDKKESLWQEVATDLMSYVSKHRDILELSYWHLPSHLKPCFLFLGVFEEDKEIAVKELLHLWVSEGLIPRNEHKISEVIAENYLLELINRSMVQVVKRRSDNGVKTFIMHDLIRDMCLKLGDKENLMNVTNKKSSTYGQHHHICIHSDFCDFTSRQLGLCIRSLFCAFKDLHTFTSSLKSLRVLKLLDGDKIYDGTALRLLIRLRHLECEGSLCNFVSHTNLEFLSIKVAILLRNNTQLDMPKLRYLYFRYADNHVVDISKLPSLQTLLGISIHNLGDAERLRQLFQLRHLRCYDEGGFGKDAPELISLTQLVSFSVNGGEWTKFNSNSFPIHIRKLCISLTPLSCEVLSSIGRMPHLEIFKLDCVKFEEMMWNTNDGGFQTLKFLKLDWVHFKEWNTSVDHFPVLEHLVLEECSGLKLIPSDLGYIPTLQIIEVLYCTKKIKNSAKNIQEEQEAQGNELLKISIFGIYRHGNEDEDGDGNEDRDGDGDKDKDQEQDEEDEDRDKDREQDEDEDEDE